MNNNNKKVLRSLLYAVETGGQEYGKAGYDAFVSAYTNSPTEAGMTIGAGQWRAIRAKALLKRIKQEYPEVFKQFDTAGISADLSNYDWNTYSVSTDSTKAKAIRDIIGSSAGRTVQDIVMLEDIAGYIDTVEDMGVTNIQAQMMCVNIMHLGGTSALERVLKKTSNRNSLESIYAAMRTDQNDHSNNNQAGDEKYWSRHVKVREWIMKYAESEEDMSKTEKATQQMEAWAKDDSHGYDQAYRWGQKGDYDCSAAVIQAWENAGVPVKTNGATYTGNMPPVFLRCGFVDVTASVNRSTGAGLRRGDVLLNTSHHTAMYCGDGKEVEASINEKGTVTGGKPGDQTGKEFLVRSYRNYPWTHVLRYQEETEGECEVKLKRLVKGSKGNQVKTVQRILRELGYKGKDGKELTVDGDFGENTEYALIAFQKAQGFKPTSGKYGICAAGTWKLLVNAA